MKKSDEDIVAEFLAIEYTLAAQQAIEAFSRIRDELDRLRREKAVEEFDDVWPGCA